MKKQLFILILAVTMIILSACAESNCKVDGCNDEIYEDGYCKYHYTLNVTKEVIDETAKNAFNRIFGD